MTHYAINYAGADPKVNDAAAINDSINYLGRDTWQKSFGALVQPGAKITTTPYSTKKQIIREVRIGCMFAGIRGYPVNAILRGIWAAHQ